MQKIKQIKVSILFFCLLSFSVFKVDAQVPSITSFSPDSGSIGSIVSIKGNNLTNSTAISIGGVSAIVISNSDTSLVAMVMPTASTGSVSVTTSKGTANGGSNFKVITSKLPNTQQGNKLVGTGAVGNSRQGHSVAISADGNTAIVGGNDDSSNVGAAWIYTRTGINWTQQGNKLVGKGFKGTPSFGGAVSLSADGNTALVGGAQDSLGIGAVWVFTRTNGIWSQQGNKLVGTGGIPNSQGYISFGFALSLSADGNTALIGGINDNNKGAIWIFNRNGSTWSQNGNKLVGTGGVSPYSEFGASVALSADGNTAVVGNPSDNYGIGGMWVFTNNAGVWSQQGNKIIGTGGVNQPNQGISIALSANGNTALVGASNDNNSHGAFWVFTRSGGAWNQQGSKLVPFDTTSTSTVGKSVALSADGNTAIIGGSSDSAGIGAFWLYTRQNTVWTQAQRKLIGNDAVSTVNVQQGYSIAISADGNTAIEGAYGDQQPGSVWVFAPPPPPTITSFTPDSGAVGTLVTITGTNFTNSSITIGGVAPIIISNSGLSILAMVMPGATTGTINIANGSGIIKSTSNFKVIASKLPITQLGNKLVGTNVIGNARQGYSVALSADGNTALVGGEYDSNSVGAVWAYTRVNGEWKQQGNKIVGNGVNGAANFGISVALSADGNTALIGGSGDSTGFGAVWVYTRSAGTWIQQGKKLVCTGAIGTPAFGLSVSLSADGNTALVSGLNDNNVGALWIFNRAGTVWSQVGNKLVGTGGVSPYSELGVSVSISADGMTAIAGNPSDNYGVGAVWVFTNNGGVWSQMGNKLVGSGYVGNSNQGYSVALSADGNTAVIGGNGDNNHAGAAWVFTRSAGAWNQQGSKLLVNDSVGASWLGGTIALSADGNTLVIGGNDDNSSTGATWVFTRSNGVWTQAHSKLVGTGAIGTVGITFVHQGYSVAVSADGNTAIEGAYADNHGSGAVWIFGQESISVKGNVINPKGISIPLVTAILSSTNANTSIVTGNYMFSNLNNGSSGTIKMNKNNEINKANGVTTLDVALTQSHVLGKTLFNSPYKIIAADVNGDGKITTLDIVYMKRLILGLDTTFTNTITKKTGLWEFVDSSYKFPDTTNPFPFKDSISFNGLTASMLNETFIGCKLGDVNWDWNPAIARPIVNSLNTIELSYSVDDSKVYDGYIHIPVKVKNFKEMLGMQFTISFDASKLQYQGIGNNPLGMEAGTNHDAEGNISFLWVDAKNEIKTLVDGSILIELVFKINQPFNNQIINLSSAVTSIAAYDKEYNLHDIVMKPSLINVNDVVAENWAVSPNPVIGDIIHLNLNLKTPKSIVLRLLDNTGKVLLVKLIEGMKGNNAATINVQNKFSKGTYYIQAIGINGESIKKVIVAN